MNQFHFPSCRFPLAMKMREYLNTPLLSKYNNKPIRETFQILLQIQAEQKIECVAKRLFA